MKKPIVLAAVAAGCLGCAAAAQAGEQAGESVESFRALVTHVVEAELAAWIADPLIIYAVNEQNAIHAAVTARQIERMERSWHGGASDSLLVQDLLDRQGSHVLRDRRLASKGVVTEIILMDAHGLNVAISDRTSDVWQGDEAKYLETYPKGAGAVHVSALARDESTGLVQTQVSMTVIDPETGEPIGAVTFGIDLSRARALSSEAHVAAVRR